MVASGKVRNDLNSALGKPTIDVNANEMTGGVGMVLAGVTVGVPVMEAGLADCCLVESGWVR